MSLFRLADLMTAKYNLQSQAASIEEIVNGVKRDLINCYNLYVNSSKAKDPVLQMLADAGEPVSKSIISYMEDIVSNIDTLSLVQLFNRVNKILEIINAVKSVPKNPVRIFIDDNLRGNKQSEINYRIHMKSKWENIISRLSSILHSQGKILAKFQPKEEGLAGNRVLPQRRDLSKDKLLMFMKTLAAQKYGLDNLDVMTRILSFPDLREKVTTLINAIDRNHLPKDGPEVMQETSQIMESFKNRQTNQDFFEAGEDEAQKQIGTTFEEEKEPKQASQKLINKYNNLSYEQWIKESK